VLPVDSPWWDDHYPPNGFGCKCGVRQISKAEAEALGVDTAPDDGYTDWTNPKTGETEQLPAGVDPGWNYNPGEAGREQALSDLETE
jgi:uncharacterized protein with gpF-like domain